MAAKTTSKKGAAKSGNRKSNAKKGSDHTNKGIQSEIVILASLAVCILLVISNFGLGGIIGRAVSSVMFGIFGLTAYVVPILIFCAIAFVISNKGNMHAYIKLAAGIILLMLICTLLELIVNSYDSSASLISYYQKASEHHNAGGFLGGCLVHILCPLFGVIGTYVVVIIMMIICAVLITERSFLRVVRMGGSRAYEDARRHKENSVKKRKEKERLRQEQDTGEGRRKDRKVSGVSFATTLKGKSPEVRELYPESDPEQTGFVIDRGESVNDEESLAGEKASAADESEVSPEMSASDGDMESMDLIQGTGNSPGTGHIKARSGRKSKTDPEQLAEEVSGVEAQIQGNQEVPRQTYRIPPLTLLGRGKSEGGDSDEHLRATALKLEQILRNFGVNVHVTNACCGPTVTRYEIQPEQGVKVSKIVGLADDIKLNLAVEDLRIEAPIPGKAAVGIEVPNKGKSAVRLRDLLESSEFRNSKSNISFAVGKDIAGKVVISDIAKMPHLLIAGATGSGKSVCINTLIMSIIYKASPDDVKLIMIDPKVVELSVYNGIPHLLIPVVTDPKKASGALNWAVAEMMKRYQLFAEFNVRDMKGFNTKRNALKQKGTEENLPDKMAQIVIIVDEFADLMMVAPGEVENAICRLAQLARAAGIHLILATQRPSVNVITGLIKANMPSRIALATTSGVDSRTIIDMNGAEKLLGNGDMLFYPAGYSKPVRVQGSFVSDEEVQKVVDYLIEKNGNADYSMEIEEHVNASADGSGLMPGAKENSDDRDAYFAEAGKFIIEKEKASIGMLQRMFKIGFNRAARIMDQLAEAGVVGGEEGTKPRKVLMTMEEFQTYLEENH